MRSQIGQACRASVAFLALAMRREWARRGLLLLLFLSLRAPADAMSRTTRWGPRWLARLVARYLTALATRIGVTHDVAWPAREIAPDRRYVLVWHPHGAYTFSALFIGALLSLEGRPIRWSTGIATILFRVPVLREVLALLDAREVTHAVLDRLLGAGRSVGLQPGGIPEQLRTSHEQEQAIFAPNVAFCRLALRHGVPLLPCYLFNENQLYATTPARQRLSRQIFAATGFPLILVTGRWGLPWIVPRPTNISVRFGRPVEVGPPQQAPSAAAVEELFARYVAELRRLFDEHKALLPPDVAARGLAVSRRTARSTSQPDLTANPGALELVSKM